MLDKIQKVRDWKNFGKPQFEIKNSWLHRISDGIYLNVGYNYKAYGYSSEIYMQIYHWDFDMIHIYCWLQNKTEGVFKKFKIEINKLEVINSELYIEE